MQRSPAPGQRRPLVAPAAALASSLAFLLVTAAPAVASAQPADAGAPETPGSSSASGAASGSVGTSASGTGSAAPDAPERPDSTVTPPPAPAAQTPPTDKPAAPPPPPAEEGGRFEFGSYGRVWAPLDLRGGIGKGSNITAFGPRLVDESSYAELEMRREDRFPNGIDSRIVATLALFPPFFHFTGKALQNIGLRNLYAQARFSGWTLWAGSRMYRGDDIYLLNWWPLDNQNTLGGGVGKRIFQSGEAFGGTQPLHETTLQLHVGQQRLDNPYQYQEIPVVAPFGFGTVNVTKLDRPRIIETLKATHVVRSTNGPSGLKVILYGEAHQISGGVYRDELTNVDRGLPSDTGWMAGSQLTWFSGKHDTFASLVLRHARGIAAYDPLSVPATFTLDRTTQGASETTVAFSAHWENDHVGVMGAGYLRFFRDASTEVSTTQKYDEGVAVVRPSVFFTDNFGLSVEGSYQARRLAVLMPGSNDPLVAGVARVGVMPYFSPAGRGSFKRPQIRLLYSASFRDAGARALYAPQDPSNQRTVEHFAGLGAEWWFNSSSYP